MDPNSVVHAAAIGFDHTPVLAAQSIRGEPTTGTVAIDDMHVTETLRKVYVVG